MDRGDLEAYRHIKSLTRMARANRLAQRKGKAAPKPASATAKPQTEDAPTPDEMAAFEEFYSKL